MNETVCVAGGGPAGVMTGYLLARAGIPVVVLEKHRDFFRDFRGDTVHPSTLELFYELGLLDKFLQLPHQELTSVGGVLGGFPFQAANFRLVPGHCKFVALMPQWDFLDFLVAEAKKVPAFDLRLEHEVTGLQFDGGRVTAVQVRAGSETFEIGARLIVGCDGRHSVVRKAAGLEVKKYGVPIDVLWFRISRHAKDPDQVLGNINFGRALILINRGDYFQAGLIVPKGSFEDTKGAGIEAFRENIRRIAPFLGSRVYEIQEWEQIKLLTVQINRLRRWYREGLLCIGDAAHAMSPAGGVGINLAIQDAVAAANLLSAALRDGRPLDLASVQRRREFPTRAMQFMQVNAHRLFEAIFRNTGPMKAPWQLKVATRIPGVQSVMGLVVGIGFQPEHIQHHTKTGLLKRAAIRAGNLAGEISLMLGRYNSGWRVNR